MILKTYYVMNTRIVVEATTYQSNVISVVKEKHFRNNSINYDTKGLCLSKTNQCPTCDSGSDLIVMHVCLR